MSQFCERKVDPNIGIPTVHTSVRRPLNNAGQKSGRLSGAGATADAKQIGGRLLSAHPSRRAAPLPRGRSEKGARMATMEIRVANKYRLGRKISNTLLYTHNSHDT